MSFLGHMHTISAQNFFLVGCPYEALWDLPRTSAEQWFYVLLNPSHIEQLSVSVCSRVLITLLGLICVSFLSPGLVWVTA